MFADQVEKVKFRGEEFDQFHGSPFDRGSADSYYGRRQDPHWYPQGTYKGTRVESQDMSMAQLRAYYAGYDFNEEFGDKKNWG
jgi:hypothetical protein